MLPYAYYLLKVFICSAILVAYYWIALRNKNFHGYNRFYLLASVVLSLLLPLVKINFWEARPQTGVISMLQSFSYSDEYLENVVIHSKQNYSWSISQLYPVLYLLVSLILLVVFMHALYTIVRLLIKYPVKKMDSISFLNTEAKGTPFSFLRYIFWNSNIDIETTAGRQIFKHEVAHIRERHTHDKLFINAILIVFWCNPVFWLIRKELNMIHEFIADKKAVEDNDTGAFAAMILQAAYPQHRFQLANNFFYSPIKRRLLMLTKNNSRVNYLGRILVLPLTVLVFAAFTLKLKRTEAVVDNNRQVDTYEVAAAPPVSKEESLRSYELLRSLQPESESDMRTYVEDTVPKRLASDPRDRASIEKEKLSSSAALNTSTALIILDGKEISEEEMKTLKPNSIGSIHILKGREAVATYGDKALNGAIVIDTRQEQLNEVTVVGQPSGNNTFIFTGRSGVLYIGVDNPVTVSLPDVNPDDIHVQISKGSITGSKGSYIARVSTVGEATVTISKRSTGEIISTRIYQVRVVPDPSTLAPATVEGKPVAGNIVALTKELQEKANLDEVVVTGRRTDNVIFTKVEVEPMFPGGNEAWKKYLVQHIDAGLPVDEGWKAGTYQVMVQFIVNANGKISNVTTLNYKNTRTAKACIEMIMAGPDWIPAMQNGKKVSAYRKQPITFVVEEQK